MNDNTDPVAALAAAHAQITQLAAAVDALAAHSCHQGPLCAFWYSDAAGMPSGIEEPEPCCAHGSCARMIYEHCDACVLDSLAAEEARRLTEGPFSFDRDDPTCPTCGSRLHCSGSYGAPGRGYAWHCDARPVTHHWSEVQRGLLHSADSGAHIMTEADVR